MQLLVKLKKIKKFIQEAREFKNILLQPFDILLHKLIINTSPYDYYRYKFYKPGKTYAYKSLYVGFFGSKYYPYEKNLVQFTPLLDNKFIFKVLLSGFGLPQPELVMTIGRRYQINDFHKFCNAVKQINFDFVIKPIQGAEGLGIRVINYDYGGFFEGEKKISIHELWKYVQGGAGHGNYLIEKKIIQNKVISKIYPKSLNTFRVKTIKLDEGWLVLSTIFRIGQKGNIVDNSDAGGIVVTLDRNGKVLSAYDSITRKFVQNHPGTDFSFKDATIPGYADAVSLALKASKKFSILGTIGWDIGISIDGPVIIEGNNKYGCTNTQMITSKPLLEKDIAQQLKPHYFWSKWDKTRMYPKMKGKITG